MAAPIIDAREIPAEWIVRELLKVCGPQCPVDIYENTVPTLLHDGEEDDARHTAKKDWWDAWRAYFYPAPQFSPSASFQQLSADDMNCADHPLALGCDGLLLVLAAILAVLVAIKAGIRVSQWQSRRH